MYRVVALFDRKAEAAYALQELLASGYELSDISIVVNSNKSSVIEDVTQGNALPRLSKIGLAGDIADTYNNKIEEGSILLAVPVGDEQERGMVTVIFDDFNGKNLRAIGDFQVSKLLIRR